MVTENNWGLVVHLVPLNVKDFFTFSLHLGKEWYAEQSMAEIFQTGILKYKYKNEI